MNSFNLYNDIDFKIVNLIEYYVYINMRLLIKFNGIKYFQNLMLFWHTISAIKMFYTLVVKRQ